MLNLYLPAQNWTLRASWWPIHQALLSATETLSTSPSFPGQKELLSREERLFLPYQKKKKSYTIHTLEPRETRINNALPWTTHLCSCPSHNTKTSLIWEVKQDRKPKHCQLKMSLNRGGVMLRTVYKSASRL